MPKSAENGSTRMTRGVRNVIIRPARTRIEIEAHAELRTDQYGFDAPTLVAVTTVADIPCSYRHNRAAGLRAAAEIEIALADVGDLGWSLDNPRWGDEQHLPKAWRSTWQIRLEGLSGANVEVAMKALERVAAKLNGAR